MKSYGNSRPQKGEGGEIERKPNAASVVKGLKNNTPFEEKWSRLQLDKEPDRDDLDLQHFVNVSLSCKQLLKL